MSPAGVLKPSHCVLPDSMCPEVFHVGYPGFNDNPRASASSTQNFSMAIPALVACCSSSIEARFILAAYHHAILVSRAIQGTVDGPRTEDRQKTGWCETWR